MHDSKPAPPADSIRYGHRAPTFVMTPEWIIVAGLSPQAVALYTVLLAHVNRQRHDGTAWPGMDVLAELLGYRRRQSVQPYVRELAALGAVDVEAQTTRTGRRNIYIVNEIPPDDYVGAMSLAEFHAERRARKGWDAVAHHGSGGQASDGSCAVAANNQTNASRRNQRDEDTSSDAASGAPLASERGDIEIFKPRGFDDWDDRRVWQYLTGAAMRILRDQGLEPAPDAADRIGHALKSTTERGHDRDDLIRLLAGTIKLAGTDHKTWGSLATRAA